MLITYFGDYINHRNKLRDMIIWQKDKLEFIALHC